MSNYTERVTSRSTLRYYLGLMIRAKNHIKYSFNRWIARRNGAIIGENTIINYKLAKIANSNLIIGNNCSIMSNKLGLQTKIIIGNNVIIGEGVEIVVGSHNIDSLEWEMKLYGIEVFDFVWLANNCLILPTCRLVGYGAVVGGGSVVTKNVENMSVVAGNPAKEIRKRKMVHSDLVVSSLSGGDFNIYKKTYKERA